MDYGASLLKPSTVREHRMAKVCDYGQSYLEKIDGNQTKGAGVHSMETYY